MVFNIDQKNAKKFIVWENPLIFLIYSIYFYKGKGNTSFVIISEF